MLHVESRVSYLEICISLGQEIRDDSKPSVIILLSLWHARPFITFILLFETATIHEATNRLKVTMDIAKYVNHSFILNHFGKVFN